MDPNYGRVGPYHGFHVNRRSIDGSLDLDDVVQHDIVQQLREDANSPARRKGDNSGVDPPSPPATHQQTSIQPHAPPLSPRFPAPGLGGMMQSTHSTNAPPSALTSGDFGWTGFSAMPYMSYQAGGIGGSRHGSIDFAGNAMSMAGSPPRLVNQSIIPTQRPLPNFSPAEIIPTIPSHYTAPCETIDDLHRRSRTRRASRDDEEIGIVLANRKRFKCIDNDCKDLTFGRLADLRRHYEQLHCNEHEEYFCKYSGCPRSHAPTGGSGRSFGTRKDKRDEHERMVHNQKRTRRSSSSEKSL